MEIEEIKNQDWIGVGWVLDYLNEKNISFNFDEFGIETEKGHIDIYDGMQYKNSVWSIDWDNSPECKTNELF